MAILTRLPSDVRFYESDLSSFLVTNSSAAVAQVLVSGKGPTTPTLFTAADDYFFACGYPDASVSFDHYMAQKYFEEGNQLWAVRAVGTGNKTAGAVVKLNSGGNTVISSLVSGIADPTVPDWGTLVSVGETPLFLVYSKWGPGSYGNRYAISIDSPNLNAPSGVALSSSSTGGFLPDASYDYVVSAVASNGYESLASTTNTTVVASSTVTNKVTVTWTAITGAAGYKIYRKLTASSTFDLLTTIGAASASYVDTGNAAPDATKHPILSSGDLAAPSNRFTVKVYDYDVALTVPVETFEVALRDEVDETGSQMEIQARINPFSRYISVRSNVASLITTPVLKSVATTALTGGTSGSAPTSSQINAAWGMFLNKEAYVVDVLMEWRNSVTIQQEVARIAEARNDAVAFLAAPSDKQAAQTFVDYRNIDLNLNTSYAALFGPDTMISDIVSGKMLYIPPVGYMAGLYARTHRVAQPWFSIAGLNRGLLNGVLKTRYIYDEGEATLLVQAQCNYIRTFRGRGIALWEQFTLQNRNSALQFLNVRFLLNILKRSLYDFLIYSLQEQNDEITRRQIKFGLEDYLSTVKAARGISDYRVIINNTNNPPSFVNSGIMGVSVYIVPILPAREIRLTLVVGKQGLEISEDEIATAGIN